MHCIQFLATYGGDQARAMWDSQNSSHSIRAPTTTRDFPLAGGFLRKVAKH